jgi:hypothetical protein
VSKAVYKRLVIRVTATARAGLISAIYHRTTELGTTDLCDSRAVTLMGTDVERICSSLGAFAECWVSALEIAVGVFLLERQVSVACVAPAAVSLGSFSSLD